MAGPHSVVRPRTSVVAPSPLDIAGVWYWTGQLVGGLATRAARMCALTMSAIRLGHELEGATPRRRQSLANGWLDAIGR